VRPFNSVQVKIHEGSLEGIRVTMMKTEADADDNCCIEMTGCALKSTAEDVLYLYRLPRHAVLKTESCAASSGGRVYFCVTVTPCSLIVCLTLVRSD